MMREGRKQQRYGMQEDPEALWDVVDEERLLIWILLLFRPSLWAEHEVISFR